MAKEVKKKDVKKDNKKEEKTTKNSSNVKGMRAELKKVTWPTRKELFNSTMAVIVIVVITAIIVFLLDVVFESVSTYGINKLRTVVSNSVNNEVTTTQDAQEEIVTDDTVDESYEDEIDVIDATSEMTDATIDAPTTEE